MELEDEDRLAEAWHETGLRLQAATDQQRGRYASACLRKLELSACIVESYADYVETACRIGGDREFREWIVEKIRMRKPALFEDRASVTEHDRIFHELLAAVR